MKGGPAATLIGARWIARFSERLKALRVAQGISGRALSARAGLGIHAVSNLENGKEPGLTTLLALQSALGLATLEELLDDLPTWPPMPSSEWAKEWQPRDWERSTRST